MRRRGIFVLFAILPACGDDGAGGPGGSGGAPSTTAGAPTTTTATAGPTTTGAGGGAGGGGADPGPPPGNALALADGTVMPLYPVASAALETRAIGFVRIGDQVTARDEHGGLLWDADLGPGSLFGGFDFDDDGVPDLGLVRSEDTGTPCGMQTIIRTRLDVARGASGEVFPLTAELDAICWNFSGTIYPTVQWTDLGVLFGSESNVLATAPYYAQAGTFWQFNGSGFDQIGTFVYPSVVAYGVTYPGAALNPYGQGIAHIPNSHVANGLLVAPDELAFFTSARAVAYAATPEAPAQLLLDLPYLTGGRTDIAGRNYGLVALDPSSRQNLVLLSGTSADTLHADMIAGALVSDPWGQIERHVSIVDRSLGSVDDRFFSYAHDNGDGNQYEGRVVYPDTPFVRATAPSRLAFNVYAGGRWRVHVTAPGSTSDAVTMLDWFLWDIRDLEGDGMDEWVLSPTKDPADPDVPGYYFAKWRTVIARWNEATLALDPLATHEAGIPWLTPFFRMPVKTTSRSFLYPSLTERQPDGTLSLLLRSPAGDLVRVAPW